MYEVKPGTASGTRVRLKGKGMPSVRNAAQRGDHYITLIVDIPTKLNQEQKDALMAYEKALTVRRKVFSANKYYSLHM